MSFLCSLLSRESSKPEDWDNEGPIEVELPEFSPRGLELSTVTVEAQDTSFQSRTREEESVKVG